MDGPFVFRNGNGLQITLIGLILFSTSFTPRILLLHFGFHFGRKDVPISTCPALQGLSKHTFQFITLIICCDVTVACIHCQQLLPLMIPNSRPDCWYLGIFPPVSHLGFWASTTTRWTCQMAGLGYLHSGGIFIIIIDLIICNFTRFQHKYFFMFSLLLAYFETLSQFLGRP